MDNNNVYRIFFAFFVVSVMLGCNPNSHKTDSMIFRESAIRDAQKPIERSLALLTSEVRQMPLNHLDVLIVAKNAKKSAQNIYKQSQIVDYKDAQLQELETFYASITPSLVEHAKSLLTQTVERTVLLRKEIEDAKNQPYSARNTDTSQLVKFLGAQYNIDVKSCCLTQLSQIDQLLHGSHREHRDLLVLIRSINSELGEIIKDEAYASRLMKTIASI